MSTAELKNISLAYTVKPSTATTQEQFLNDYEENLKLFRELCKSDEKVYDFKN